MHLLTRAHHPPKIRKVAKFLAAEFAGALTNKQRFTKCHIVTPGAEVRAGSANKGVTEHWGLGYKASRDRFVVDVARC